MNITTFRGNKMGITWCKTKGRRDSENTLHIGKVGKFQHGLKVRVLSTDNLKISIERNNF